METIKKIKLSKPEYNSVKASFKNICAYFLHHHRDYKPFLDCIQKWGIQLNLPQEEYFNPDRNTHIPFEQPKSPINGIEQVYDMVYMIYLDNVVEDVELEVTTLYAEAMGFEGTIVGELLKAIVTAPYDGITKDQLRKDLELFLKSQ